MLSSDSRFIRISVIWNLSSLDRSRDDSESRDLQLLGIDSEGDMWDW